eukprot:g13419.t1
MKRVQMREKPRSWTGPFENPVRRWVRLREKAKQFCELPPARKIPVPKTGFAKSGPPGTASALLKDIEDVPDVADEVLERRLAFLLGDDAIAQQLHAPLVPGATPYLVEKRVWERQMIETRRIYRTQYLKKLQQVTATEREKELELQTAEFRERKERKRKILLKQCEERKRRAILRDRLRVDSKVSQILQMQRRSKLKMRRLQWVAELAAKVGGAAAPFNDHAAEGANAATRGAPNRAFVNRTAGEVPEHLGLPARPLVRGGGDAASASGTSSSASSSASASFSSTLGGAPPFASAKPSDVANPRGGRRSARKNKKEEQQQAKTHQQGAPASTQQQHCESTSTTTSSIRSNKTNTKAKGASGNIFDRDVSVPHLMRQIGQAVEFPKHKSRRIPEKRNLFREVAEESYESQHVQRATLEYGNFTLEEKKALLDEKIGMVRASLERGEHLAEMPNQANVERVLLDQLTATRLAMDEEDTVKDWKERVQAEKKKGLEEIFEGSGCATGGEAST